MSDSNNRWPLISNLAIKHELSLLGIILLVAIVFRVLNWNLIEIEHFDEAVYVSNIYFRALGGETYPAQEFYAPPLVPQMFETVMSIFGDSSTVIFCVNLVASLLTLVLLWWMGRSWFGSVCGLVAAAFFAASEVQISLCRSAMTEPIFGFFFCLSLHLMYLTFRFTWNAEGKTQQLNLNRSVILGLLAGLACSCCWVSKYNGWLPCAIILTSLVLNLVLTRKLFHVKQILAPMLAMILGGFMLRGLNVWKLVEDQLYLAVSRNHAGYFVGLAGWWESMLEHKTQLDQTSSTLNVIVLACLLLLVILSNMNLKKLTSIWQILEYYRLTFIGVIFLIWGELGLLYVTFFLTGISLIYKSINIKPACFTWNQLLPVVMLIVWWASLLVAIPLYSPYPRLIYPWLLASWLGLGLTLAQQQDQHFFLKVDTTNECITFQYRALRDSLQHIYRCSIIIFVLGFIAITVAPTPRLKFNQGLLACDAWQVRTGLRDVSRETVELIQRDIAGGKTGKVPLVYQLSEPAISFQMMRLGVACLPVQNLSFTQNKELFQKCKVYFMVGNRGRKSGDFVKEWEKNKSQFKLIRSFEYYPSLFVWRDERGDASKLEIPRELIELYEVIQQK